MMTKPDLRPQFVKSDASRLPPLQPEPAAGPVFRTEALNFSAALIASKLLTYQRTELLPGNHTVVFVFADPERAGLAWELKYQMNQFPGVAPNLLFAAKSYLQDRMAECKQNGGHR